MRDVKFRYFWKGEWHYINFSKDNLGIKFAEFEKRAKTSELFQFTGLTDKNGNDIYEGDIVKQIYGHYVLLIKWCGLRFDYEIIKQKDKNTNYDIRLYRSYENLEVIGNSFENKELLPKEKKEARRLPASRRRFYRR